MLQNGNAIFERTREVSPVGYIPLGRGMKAVVVSRGEIDDDMIQIIARVHFYSLLKVSIRKLR